MVDSYASLHKDRTIPDNAGNYTPKEFKELTDAFVLLRLNMRQFIVRIIFYDHARFHDREAFTHKISELLQDCDILDRTLLSEFYQAIM